MESMRTAMEMLEELDRARIRAARGTGKVRISLRDLAAAAGVPRASLANYLSGATLMPSDVLDAVVRALGITEVHAWATAWERATAACLPPARGRPAPTPRQLPAGVTDFMGRETALKALDELLAGDHGQAVVISAIAGPAGVGKTALAVRWAHRISDRFPDGQLFVDLRGHGAGEPVPAAYALECFLRALGVRTIPPSLDERATLYRSSLSGKRVLLLLDDALASEQIRPLLPGSAGCLVIVTSRDDLSGLVARDGAYRLDLDRLPHSEAVHLVDRLLSAERTAREPEARAELIRLCGGLPLALRAACERIVRDRSTTMAELVEVLAARTRTLDVSVRR
jgi:hypothetical protein